MESESAKVVGQKRPRRWWRYSLRTFLVVVTVFCVWLGITSNRARNQKQAVEALLKLGEISVWYDYQIDEYSHPQASLQSHIPRWLIDSLGRDFFHTVAAVNVGLGSKLSDDDLTLVGQFEKLKILTLVDNTTITSDGLQHLKNLAQLECLILTDTNVDSSGLAHLENLQNLTQLSLSQTNVDDKGLKSIGKLTNLKILMLAQCPITDSGLKYLKPLATLEFLEFGGTAITDERIKHLVEIKSLKQIWLRKSKVTEQGKTWLIEQLPNCEVL